MAFEIEIIEGHDTSSYFWFRPVVVKNTYRVEDEDVLELNEEFSIEEDDVYCFLEYFFRKYFDEKLIYNKNRYESDDKSVEGFEWYLTHNFYTYETLYAMSEEIRQTASLLETDFDSPLLDDVKRHYAYCMCPPNRANWFSRNAPGRIYKYRYVVSKFYRRFVNRLHRMMKNNPSTNLISIMGP